ncbi:HNH endonuclease signature motif containing protein [Ahrensia sp. 13_GOM-1096m]|uniref:HNH endonuclease signature motif containing protein n=1 Tax=Ahrensia sp. 13_GOM-1096m TaxID=1380380 RepID=UPI0006875486|nr:HNH endonuclease signature motif containing protein [Ahrensia sp. 13_GOM-1096m]
MQLNKSNPATTLAGVGRAKSKANDRKLRLINDKSRAFKKQVAKSTYSAAASNRKSRHVQPKLTQAYIRELLLYNKTTGEMTWRVDRGRFRCKGKPAGTSCRGYISIEVDGRLYKRSRLAWLYMTGEMPPVGYYVDHRDRDKGNDAWNNLRLATPAENARNRTPCARNKSGFVGVCKNNGDDRWTAFINIDGKCRTIGTFAEFDDACDARIAAEIEHYGEFSRRAA